MTTDSNPDPHADHWHDQDVQGRADNDVTREFWGDGVGWSPQPTASPESVEVAPPGGLRATVGRWWNSTTSGRRAGTRTHTTAVPAVSSDEADGVTRAEEDLDDPVTACDDAWDTAPSEPPRSGVDPLLARLGGLAVAFTLLVPVVMGFTSDDGDTVRTASIAAGSSQTKGGGPAAEEPVEVVSEATAVVTTEPASAAASPGADAPVVVEPTTTAGEPMAAPGVAALDACTLEYEVAVGDFWIRIADGSGAALADLLAVNDATVSTPLYPGREICLPPGAVTPPAPTTPASTPTPVTSSTRNSSTSSNNSTAPTTTSAPTPPPLATPGAPGADVEAIIRFVWPDELEERALEIARRESNLISTARNSCCHGLFQVHWSAHRSWLSGLGVTSVEQLYDPATNALAARTLYERAGGWGPWGG